MDLISQGKNASVFKKGDNAVKLFKEGTPKTDVLNEALNTTRVEETGFPIPSINEVSIIEDKWAITMNYIEGKTLAQIMKEDPDNQEKYISQMVDLQLEMHSKRAP